MFLFNVNKKEIIDIVNSFENKLSKDKGGFNMYIMKKIVNQVVDPFLHICNLSFNKGIFPDAMKVAKVIPIHKSGKKMFLIIIDQFQSFLSSLKFWKDYFVTG